MGNGRAFILGLTQEVDMSELKEELKTVQGVGEATATEIIDIVGEHTDEPDNWLERAYSALESGDEEAALTYLKRSNK